VILCTTGRHLLLSNHGLVFVNIFTDDSLTDRMFRHIVGLRYDLATVAKCFWKCNLRESVLWSFIFSHWLFEIRRKHCYFKLTSTADTSTACCLHSYLFCVFGDTYLAFFCCFQSSGFLTL